MQYLLRILLLGLILSLSLPSWAATSLPLTLGSAVQLALQNNPDLALIRNAKQSADVR